MSIKINLGENCKLNHLQHNVSIICFLKALREKCQRAHASNYKREREREFESRKEGKIKLTVKLRRAKKKIEKKIEAKIKRREGKLGIKC